MNIINIKEINSIDKMLFKINDSDKVTILSNGNVGIGTITPTNKLHIEGDIKLSGTIINSAGEAWKPSGSSASAGFATKESFVRLTDLDDYKNGTYYYGYSQTQINTSSTSNPYFYNHIMDNQYLEVDIDNLQTFSDGTQYIKYLTLFLQQDKNQNNHNTSMSLKIEIISDNGTDWYYSPFVNYYKNESFTHSYFGQFKHPEDPPAWQHQAYKFAVKKNVTVSDKWATNFDPWFMAGGDMGINFSVNIFTHSSNGWSYDDNPCINETFFQQNKWENNTLIAAMELAGTSDCCVIFGLVNNKFKVTWVPTRKGSYYIRMSQF